MSDAYWYQYLYIMHFIQLPFRENKLYQCKNIGWKSKPLNNQFTAHKYKKYDFFSSSAKTKICIVDHCQMLNQAPCYQCLSLLGKLSHSHLFIAMLNNVLLLHEVSKPLYPIIHTVMTLEVKTLVTSTA